MNFPYHILLYQRKRQSYRDLPIRVAELGTVYGYELSGSLHDLFCVRGFTQLEFCKEVSKKLRACGLRVELCHGERLPKLIRNADTQKVLLMVVVGPKEVETGTVTVRSRFGGELGTVLFDDFINKINIAVETKTAL